MCGIVGYLGDRQASEVLLDGLKRLEYRGYDSAGVALFANGASNNEFAIMRCKGKLANLANRISQQPMPGHIGLGHTRWATHGAPSEANAHPHWSDNIVVVHNGIIENYLELKDELAAHGHTFTSQTDTEVIPHLIEYYWGKSRDLKTAFMESVNRLQGAYSIGMFSRHEPETIYAAKYRSPLIVGIGEGENFLASDIPALLSYTRDIVILEDGECVVLRREGVKFFDSHGKSVAKDVQRVDWTASMAEKGGYPHFMLKEIHEQPSAIVQTIQGRLNQSQLTLNLDDTGLTTELAKKIKRITMVACGTSWHAALAGKYMIEALAKVPVDVDLASEFRYRSPIIEKDTLVIAVSQSGETADTLAAVDEAQQAAAKVLAICNVVDSSIARAADYTLYTHAGPEIGVASTKAFTTQLVSFYMLSLHLGLCRGQLAADVYRKYVQDLVALPSLCEVALKIDAPMKKLGEQFFQYADFLYLGRGLSYPIALEGALKLKEISYIHAEGYPAGEIKHGPIALIDENMPVLVVGADDDTFEKTLSNLQEVKARGGITLLCVSEKRASSIVAAHGVDHKIVTPTSNAFLLPVLQTIPLQLLAYHIAVHRGTDVDQPRNLAKSVTVE